MSYEHVIRAAGRLPWAIMESKAEEIAALLDLLANGGQVPAEVRAQLAAEHRPWMVEAAPLPNPPPQGGRGQDGGSIAVIPVYGVISQRANLMSEMSGGGGTSIQKLTQAFRQAVGDPSIAAIVLDVDSPGGSVFGVQELAEEIRRARAQKPIVANFNSLGASAAYWIGSAASEAVVTPGGQVGSIGVLALHVDFSAQNEMLGVQPTLITAGKYKGEGSPDFPLGDEAREYVQGQVDEYYAAFVDAVAVGRGVSPARVRDGFGQGRVLLAKPALAAGMIDRIETLDQTIARLGKPQGRAAITRRGMAAAEAFEVITLPVEDAAFVNVRERVIAQIGGGGQAPALPDASTIVAEDASPVAVAERDGSLGTPQTPGDDQVITDAMALEALNDPEASKELAPEEVESLKGTIEARMRRLKL